MSNTTGTAAINSAKIAAICDQLAKEWPGQIQLAAIQAKMHRISYDAHIKEGFTPEQALVLCMKPSFT